MKFKNIWLQADRAFLACKAIGYAFQNGVDIRRDIVTWQVNSLDIKYVKTMTHIMVHSFRDRSDRYLRLIDPLDLCKLGEGGVVRAYMDKGDIYAWEPGAVGSFESMAVSSFWNALYFEEPHYTSWFIGEII